MTFKCNGMKKKLNIRNYPFVIIMFLMLFSGCFKNDEDLSSVTDIDGNIYMTVTIGTQVWMSQNLRTTKYRNGDPITLVTDSAQWCNLSTGAHCYYVNHTIYASSFGRLYNWYAVNDSRNICPSGWHIPSDAEWTLLATYLGNDSLVGGKLKETGTLHWKTPNNGATNSTGWAGLPGGGRDALGSFIGMGVDGCWWSSTASTAIDAWSRLILSYRAGFYREDSDKKIGFSVRCLKN